MYVNKPGYQSTAPYADRSEATTSGDLNYCGADPTLVESLRTPSPPSSHTPFASPAPESRKSPSPGPSEQQCLTHASPSSTPVSQNQPQASSQFQMLDRLHLEARHQSRNSTPLSQSELASSFKVSVGTEPGFMSRKEFARQHNISFPLANSLGDGQGNLSPLGRKLEES